MAVNNRIAPTAKKNDVKEYIANGEVVRLSPAIIRKYLVNGGGNVTDEEIMMFLSLCRFQHLNPFLREAYLIKYGSQPATMVVGKDVFVKRAKKSPEFLGFQAGIIVIDADGHLAEREGTYYDKDGETLVGGWAKVHIKGYDVPVYASVSLDEYIGRKRDGEVNGQWAGKPATMIRKVALMQALREAFPEQNSGLYTPEEISGTQEIVLDEAPVVMEEDAAPAPVLREAQTQAAPTPQAAQNPGYASVADELFG